VIRDRAAFAALGDAMADPYAPYPHRPSKHRFLIFVPLDSGANDPNVPIIFDTTVDVNLNCANCGQTLITHRQGEQMKPKRGVLDEGSRRIRCPHCEKASELATQEAAEKAATTPKTRSHKRTDSRKSPRTRQAKPTSRKDSGDNSPKK
jgi:DNA-directed RNA polymerase subunit RPC12/RpoP